MNPLIASMMSQSVQYLQSGNLDSAESLLKKVLKIHSKNFDALHILGMIKGMKNDHTEAKKFFKKAVAVNPGNNFAQFNLAKALSESGEDLASLPHHVKATRLAPNHPEAWVNYGKSLGKLNRHEEALACYAKALGIKSGFAEALANQGTSLSALERFDEALACFSQVLETNPNLAEVWSNLGAVLQQQGRYVESLEAYDKSLALVPGYAQTWFNKGLALNELKRHEDALLAFDQAIALSSGYAEAWCAKGYTCNELLRFAQGSAACEKAIAINPGLADAWGNLGQALQAMGRLSGSVDCYLKALALRPGLVEVHNNLGNALQELGRADEAAVQYRQALAIKPDYGQAYSNLLFIQAYQGSGSSAEYLALARGWEEACVGVAVRAGARKGRFRNPPRNGRRLKVGYVSGDFRQHAASFFVEQLFERHDRRQIELFAYSAHGVEDAVTARLRALVEHWVPVVQLVDAALRDRIEADGIDVLIDLSGHTAKGRLGAFAQRCAPVQAHYLGFFASTGLSEMDYWIGDDILTPASADGDFSERIWRLPRVWVSYEARQEAPVPAWRPQPDGTMWLGSFNSLRKLSLATLDVWARVLCALPEGRLLLKTKELADPENRVRVLAGLASRGVAAERVELLDGTSTPDWRSHMACYDRLDLALDPVGAVGGGTTTCDALWMGVPVVTHEGDRMSSRMTASMLHAVGHPEWIAQSEDDYVQKIIKLARNTHHRAALRPIARAQMAASPLCDAAGLARYLETAYGEMFDRWQLEHS